jgi:hypothetical protein
MTKPVKNTKRQGLLFASVFLFTCLMTTTALLAKPVALLDKRANRDEGGFEIAQMVAATAMGVLLIILGFTLFKPVITSVVDKIKTDILGQS